MGSFLDVFRSRKELRSNPFNDPSYPMNEMNVNAFLSRFGGQNLSDSGESVTPHTSLQTSTVWACVSLISSQIAVNALNMYQFDGNGSKTLAVNHPYFDLITNRPNEEQDATAFRTAVETAKLLWGNGYIELERDRGGRIVALWHRHASMTKPIRKPNGQLAYETTDNVNRDVRIIDATNMIHLMDNTLDGYIGLSPISYARQSIGSKIAMDKFGGRFFANYAMPQLALVTKQKVKPEDKVTMRQAWEELQTGNNQHRVAVLDQEMTIEKLSIAPEDAQFLESKNASEKEIAAIFGVPGYAIGLLDKGIKANVEQQAQDLYNYCLRPRMVKWEKAFTNKIFSQIGRSAGRYGVKFDVRELLRPDSASRQAYYQSCIQNGILSQNECRDIEGYNPIPDGDGDGYYIQLNMQSLALANSSDPIKDGPDVEAALEEEENSLPKRLGQNYRGLFKDGVQRLMKSNNRDYKNAYRCLWPTIEAISTGVRSCRNISDPLKPEDDGYKAIEKFLQGVEHRASKWTEENIEQICDEELRRVAKSLIFAVNSDLAKAQSKRDIAQLEAGETEQENESE